MNLDAQLESIDLDSIPVEERGKIHASVVLPNLPVIVDKLISLALYRQATSVYVGIDFQTFTINVEDNGEGWDLSKETEKDSSSFYSGGYNFGWSKGDKQIQHREKGVDSFYSFFILHALRNISSSIVVMSRSKETPSTNILEFIERPAFST